MKIREEYSRKKEKLKHIFGVSSRNHNTLISPQAILQAEDATATFLQSPASSDGFSASLHSHLAGVAVSTPSNHVLRPPLELAPALSPSTNPPMPTMEPGRVGATGLCKVAERAKITVWPGLKALLKIFESAVDVFPPLKSAVGGLSECIELLEASMHGISKDRKDYLEMGTILDSILLDLSDHMGNPMSQAMTLSMKNLCIGLNREVKIIREKQEKGVLQRKETLDDNDEVMECYRRVQIHLERLALNANLNMWRIVDKQETESSLNRLVPGLSAVYNSAESEDVQRRACAPETREQELSMLLAWARDNRSSTAETIYWMNGMAGTGKTTISYSVCAELESTAELGASFFCSRLLPECRDVKRIIPSIAYQLARFSHPFRSALSNVLRADPDVHTRVLKTQFDSLLVRPLLEVRHALPVDFVVVIDALDECENERATGQILDIMISQVATSGLPVRFLLSSRPEPEIYSRMMGRVGRDLDAHLALHNLDETVVKNDIGTYLRNELETVGLPVSQLNVLIERCGVLFIYAATAARYIKDGLQTQTHEERLNMVVSSPAPVLGSMGRRIDGLYASILWAAFNHEHLNEIDQELMALILKTVICVREPITAQVLANLLGLKSGQQVEGLLRPLFSVLYISGATRLVTTLHASFPDYILDAGRSSSFHCNPIAHHTLLAKACFRAIKSSNLQFNICAFESSYSRDDDVNGTVERVGRAVDANILYACRYWASHLEAGERTEESVEMLHEFLSVRLLLWMEVLNAKKIINVGPRIIQRGESWSRSNLCSRETIELAHDAWRFVTMFAGHSVAESTPHIYLSMLPFWSRSAPITTYYGRRIRGTLETQGTAMSRRQLALLATWLFGGSVRAACASKDCSIIAVGAKSSLFVVDGTTGRIVVGPLQHDGPVLSVAISPNGVLVASGSYYGTIRLWNAQNGQAAASPLVGHTDKVNSICFNPDNTVIISGSDDQTIRIWSANTGRILFGPLVGHKGAVLSVATSPDGAQAVSGSADHTLRLWDVASGRMIGGPIAGHDGKVQSVCFSPDGTRVISGSTDNTLRIWSTHDGQMMLGPLKGHTGSVFAASFSPDGKHIVSGSKDKTLRLWDIDNPQSSTLLLEAHTGEICWAAYSPEGTRIFSASHDATIRVWDARSPGAQDSPFEAHTGSVCSVGFSHDGARILSGSHDKTARVWSAQSGQIIATPFRGHTNSTRFVSFSSDERRVVSTFADNSMQIWDTQSGRPIGNPLTGHHDTILSVCFSSCSCLLVSSSADKTVRVWNTQTGALSARPLDGHTDWVRSACFSPDGKTIATGSDDKTVRVWNARNGQISLQPFRGHTNYVYTVCFSHNGERIASGSADTSLRLWDASSGKAVANPLEGHTSIVLSVCFSPDGSLVVSGSEDKTIRLWSADTGGAVGVVLAGHMKAVCSVAFSPDGKSVVSGSQDTTIRTWDIGETLRGQGSAGTRIVHNQDSATQHLHPPWSLQNNGWVVDHHSRLLAWVPPDLHIPLLGPTGNSLLISRFGSLKLGFGPAKIGEAWAGCYRPEL